MAEGEELVEGEGEARATCDQPRRAGVLVPVDADETFFVRGGEVGNEEDEGEGEGRGEAKEDFRLDGGGDVEVEAAVGQSVGSMSGTGSFA